MKQTYRLIILFFIFIILIPLVSAERGRAADMESISVIHEIIKILPNGNAKVTINVYNVSGVNEAFFFGTGIPNRNFTSFNCNMRIVLINETILLDYNPNITDINLPYDAKYLWFNQEDSSYINFDCEYEITNYVENLETYEWLVHDSFDSKHSTKKFVLTFQIPNNTISFEIFPQPFTIFVCDLTEDCREKITFIFNGSDGRDGRVYLKYRRINLSLLELLMKDWRGYLLAAGIAIFFEKIISWLWSKRPKKKNKNTEEVFYHCRLNN